MGPVVVLSADDKIMASEYCLKVDEVGLGRNLVSYVHLTSSNVLQRLPEKLLNFPTHLQEYIKALIKRFPSQFSHILFCSRLREQDTDVGNHTNIIE